MPRTQLVFAFQAGGVVWCARIWNLDKKACVMVEVVVKLPDTLARSFGETRDLRARRVLENAAI